MAVTIQEMVARAEQLALARNIDPAQNPVTDMGMTAEALIPHAIRYAIGRDIESGGDTSNYVRHIPILLDTNGKGTMPEEILREYLCSSYLTLPFKITSYLPYADFQRRRFTSALQYYSYSADEFYLKESTNLYLVKQSPANTTVTTGSPLANIAPDTAAASVTAGDRFTIQASGVDGFIDSTAGSTITLRGRSPVSVSAINSTITEGKYYVPLKTISPVSATNGSDIISFAADQITSADIGKRLSIKTPGGITVNDAIILDVPTSTTAQLGLQSLLTTANGIATLMGVGVVIAAVSLPKIDSSSQTLDISAKIEDDAIAITAAVLSGQMPIAQLLAYK